MAKAINNTVSMQNTGAPKAGFNLSPIGKGWQNPLYSNKAATLPAPTVATQPKLSAQPSSPKPYTPTNTGMRSPAPLPVPQPNYQPSKYIDINDKYAKQASDLATNRAPLIAAPTREFGVGDMGKRLTEAEQASLSAQLAGIQTAGGLNQNSLEATMPKTISPTDMAYNPIQQGIGDINAANESSARGRVFDAGQLAGVQGLGQQNIGNQQQIGTLNNVQSTLNGLFTGYTDFGLVPLNEWKNKIGELTSNGSLAAIKTTLAGAASQMPEGEIRNQLTSISGNLVNSSPAAIKAALDAARTFIQATQGAGLTAAGQGGQGGGFSGFANNGAF